MRSSRTVSVATVAQRMNRILQTYKEQKENETTPPEASTSSTFGRMIYSTERGLELHKRIINFAAQNDSESESDLPNQSIELPNQNNESTNQSDESIDVPQMARREQPRRAVKRTAVKISNPVIKRKQRKPSSTVTSNALKAERTTPATQDVVKPIKASRSFNENDNRQSTK